MPGLQGLPVQVTGWVGYQEKESLVVPNDIHFQIAPQGQPLQSSTFFMNGTQYFIAEVRVVKVKQEGLKDFSEIPFAEIHFWGKPTANTTQKDTFALLAIPVYESFQASKTQKEIQIKGTIETYIPQGDDVRIVKYSTCVERQNGTATIHVAYWSSGFGVTSDFRNSQFKVIQTYGVPLAYLDGNIFLSSYQQYNDEQKSKGRREYKNDGGVSIPYFSNVTLSTTTPEFQKGFRMIKGFSIKQTNSAGNDIDNFKCIRINRQRDIQNGKLLIDPKTGKTLREETDIAEQEVQASLKPPTDTSSKKTYITILIILGILFGIAGIALLVYGIQFLFGTRELTNQPAVTPSTMAAAALSQNSPVA
jgi:hypothetical protein